MPDVGTPGTYGSSNSFTTLTVDSKGRVTAASTVSVESALPSVGSPGTYGSATSFPVITTDTKGRVSSVSTSTVESALPNVITAGTYGNISSFPIVTVDAKGRVTGVTISPLAGNVTAKTTGDVTNSSNVTNTALPELTLDLLPNTTYQISVQLIYRTASAGNGISMTFGAGSVVATDIVGYIETATSPTSIQNLTYNSLTTQSTFGTGAATNADRLIYGVTVLTTGASGGTFIPAFRSEGNGTVVTMRRNSKVTLEVL